MEQRLNVKFVEFFVKFCWFFFVGFVEEKVATAQKVSNEQMKKERKEKNNKQTLSEH